MAEEAMKPRSVPVADMATGEDELGHAMMTLREDPARDDNNIRAKTRTQASSTLFRGCGLGTALRDFRNSLRFILSRLTGYTGATRWRSGRCRRLTATGKLG
jgi:hypothetical protein